MLSSSKLSIHKCDKDHIWEEDSIESRKHKGMKLTNIGTIIIRTRNYLTSRYRKHTCCIYSTACLTSGLFAFLLCWFTSEEINNLPALSFFLLSHTHGIHKIFEVPYSKYLTAIKCFMDQNVFYKHKTWRTKMEFDEFQ